MAVQSGRLELLTLRPILFVAPGASCFAHAFRCGNGRPNYGGSTTAAAPRVGCNRTRACGKAVLNTANSAPKWSIP